MTDETTREPEWITIDEASQLLGISSNKLLRKLQRKDNILRTGRSVSGLLVFADDVRREVEQRSSEPTVSEAIEQPETEKSSRPDDRPHFSDDRPHFSFDGYFKTFYFR